MSRATNLVSGDTNGLGDVFVRDPDCDAVGPATIFSGDGINADTIAPVNVVLGSTWSAPLTIGHPHGTGGPLTLKVRSTAFNGGNFLSPMGGRLTEILIAGQRLAAITGTHDGVTGDVAPPVDPGQWLPGGSHLGRPVHRGRRRLRGPVASRLRHRPLPVTLGAGSWPRAGSGDRAGILRNAPRRRQ